MRDSSFKKLFVFIHLCIDIRYALEMFFFTGRSNETNSERTSKLQSRAIIVVVDASLCCEYFPNSEESPLGKMYGVCVARGKIKSVFPFWKYQTTVVAASTAVAAVPAFKRSDQVTEPNNETPTLVPRVLRCSSSRMNCLSFAATLFVVDVDTQTNHGVIPVGDIARACHISKPTAKTPVTRPKLLSRQAIRWWYFEFHMKRASPSACIVSRRSFPRIVTRSLTLILSLRMRRFRATVIPTSAINRQ